VRDALAQRGFDAVGQDARYRLSIAYATQPASVAATSSGARRREQRVRA
jgi:hypothetical protein